MKPVFLAVTIALASLFSGCQNHPIPLPDRFDCVGACVRGDKDHLNNPALAATPAGVPCTTWLCATPMTSARASCMARAADVAAQDACR